MNIANEHMTSLFPQTVSLATGDLCRPRTYEAAATLRAHHGTPTLETAIAVHRGEIAAADAHRRMAPYAMANLTTVLSAVERIDYHRLDPATVASFGESPLSDVIVLAICAANLTAAEVEAYRTGRVAPDMGILAFRAEGRGYRLPPLSLATLQYTP